MTAVVLAACAPAPGSASPPPTPNLQATVAAQVQSTLSAIAATATAAPAVTPTPIVAAPTAVPPTAIAAAATLAPTPLAATPGALASPTPRTIEDAVTAVKAYTVLVWNDEGSGSGISLGDGKVLTANHVVEGSGQLKVRFADGRQDPARAVRTDPRRDLALVQSSFRDTPIAPLRDARSLHALESLIAVGYPRADVIGVQDTTPTRGSYSGRWQSPQGVWHVQTDTPVNPGNSGGPLADADGQVIGVVRMQVRQSEGLNFAVASDEVTAFLADQEPSPLQPRPNPPPIKPELSDTSAAPRTVAPGQSLTLTYVITYDGTPAPVVLGASIRPAPGGAWVSDPADDSTVTLRQGRNSFSRSFSVPADQATGTYDIAWGLLGTDLQTSYDLRVEPAGLQVVRPGQAVTGPVDTVKQFYALLAAQNYAAAWALLSSRYQATTSYTMWVAGYANTQSVALISATSVDPTSVAVSVVATDNEAGRRVVKTFEGTWALMLQNGAWKLDVGRIRQAS